MFGMRRMARGQIVACVSMAFLSCGLGDTGRTPNKPVQVSQAALRVGDRTYGRSDLETFFKSRLDEFPSQDEGDEVKTALLDTFIEEKVLLTEAEQHHVEADAQSVKTMLESLAEAQEQKQTPEDLAALKRSVEENLKVQRYVNQFVLKEVRVTEDECQRYYQEHLGDFIRNDVVHVREILVGNKAQAEKIQALLKAGRNRNFEELARLYSKAPSAIQGGDLGRFQRGDLPEKLEKVIFPLAPGTVSRTIPTEFGYHIFLVEEKVAAHQQRFYEAKREIEEKLLLERRRSALDKEIALLAQRTPVGIYRANLGFNYTGSRYSSRLVSHP
jgi:parvulin-like peptidyl-prolyl isomerase